VTDHRIEGGMTRPNVVAWALFATLVIVAFIASALVLLRELSIPHCGERCDFVLLAWAGYAYVAWCVIIVVASLVLLVTLQHRIRSAWTFPAAGIALVVTGAVVANRLSDVALLFPT